MINRILIRIKVIQILYSYLLVEKQFSLEDYPLPPTKEKRFAYALYLDMLSLLVRIAEEVKFKREAPLRDTRFISRLRDDETLNALRVKVGAASVLQPEGEDAPKNARINEIETDGTAFEPLVKELAEKVKASAIFKNYLKDSKEGYGSGQEHLWQDIYNLVVMADPRIKDMIVSRVNYTLKGEERMQTMMNATFTNFLTAQDNWTEVRASLDRSLDKARELYFRLLLLPVELTQLQERILDENRFKFYKTPEDINPNLRFVENRLVAALAQNQEIEKFVEKENISWSAEDPILLRSLLKSITESEIYAEYMAAPESDMKSDVELWRNLFKKVLLENTDFLQALEEKSVFWNDDLEIISTFVLKTFRKFEDEGVSDPVMEKFKDKEDEAFGAELIRYVYANKDTYRLYIHEALQSGHWDTERVAFMDMVILVTALAEIMNFPKIPLSASINEYIEIAKSYSSAKSGSFVHGVLGAVVSRLQKERVLLKK